MRALALTSFGTAPSLADVAKPAPGEGEILVRIHAARGTLGKLVIEMPS